MSGYTLEVLNPLGAIEVEQQHAARLDRLEGKTIAQLGNGAWEDQSTLPAVRAALRARVPGLTVIPFDELPRGHEHIDSEVTIDLLVRRGVNGVITGNAA